MVSTSLTDSAIMRATSCTRVKRSNSSGSKAAPASWGCVRPDCICSSSCNSISRNCWRRRSRLRPRSPSALRIWVTWPSARARLIITSPAWSIRRSRVWARTRTSCLDEARDGETVARLMAGALLALGTGAGPAESCAEYCSGAWASGSPSTGNPAKASKWALSCSNSCRQGSKAADSGANARSSASTVDSMRWASSPSRSPPARRALPLKVCKTRSTWARNCGWSGACAQCRKLLPSKDSNSAPSSRNIGSNSASSASWASMSGLQSLARAGGAARPEGANGSVPGKASATEASGPGAPCGADGADGRLNRSAVASAALSALDSPSCETSPGTTTLRAWTRFASDCRIAGLGSTRLPMEKPASKRVVSWAASHSTDL